MAAAKAALDKHAEDVLVMDLREVSTMADFFVVATAASRPQLLAITEQIEQALKRFRQRPGHIEGKLTRESARAAAYGEPVSWVLVDCGDVVAHLFNPAARAFYQLERLWADAPRIPVA
jgi:ribosome-associated protein